MQGNRMNRRNLLLASGAVIVTGAAASVAFIASRDNVGEAGTANLTLTYNTEEQSDEKALLAQILQSQLKRKNINLTLEPVSSAAYNERIGKGDFASALTLWYLDYPDAEGFLTDFYSKAGYRLSKYQNPDYDRAYLRGLFSANAAEKRAGFSEAAAIVDKDLVWIPLFANREIFLMRPDAEGFRSNAYQYYDYRGVARDTIRAATDVEVQTLDPAQTYDLGSKHLVTQSYEGLVALDSNNRIVPALALSWKQSADGLELSFVLRPNVAFHSRDGSGGPRTMTAADVKSSFERTAGSASPYAYIFDQVAGVDEFRAKKASHLAGLVAGPGLNFTIRLKRPCSAMLPWLLAPAAYILPADLPGSYDFAGGSRGTGPFVLEKWDGSTARFRAHRDYWGRSGPTSTLAKQLTVSVIKDPSVQLLAFSQGELDILNVPLALYPAILDDGGKLQPRWRPSRLRTVDLNNLKFIAFNMSKSPWGNNVDLRHRVADAIDREDLVDRLLRGQARAVESVLPPGVL